MLNQTRIQLLAGSLSGGLIVLAMPKPDMGYVAFICLLPALALLHGPGSSRAFRIGGMAGLVACTGKVYWLAETLSNYGHLSWLVGAFTTLLLILYMSLYILAFFVLAARFNPASPLFPWICASLWVTLEWLQAHLLTGFPWMLLGYTQHSMLPILATARIWGVYGVSFLIVLVNATIVSLQVSGKASWRGTIAPALILIISISYGITYNPGAPEHVLKVGIAQGSIPQGRKWHQDVRQMTVEKYTTLIRQLDGKDLDFIVLPETAFPFFLNHAVNRPHYDQIVELTREMNVPMLIGSLDRTHGKTYNRAFLISKTGKVVGYQDKVHLVPFGEYIPLEFIFGYMEGLTRESGRFNPGEDSYLLDLPGRDASFGVFICYESIFPEIARHFVKNGADFIVNVTNDAWFGTTAAPFQHFAMGVFRAVENGRPLIRAANTGISGAVDASGRVLKTTKLFEPAAITVEIVPGRDLTFYTRHGDLLVVLCAAGTLFALAWSIISRRRVQN